LCEAAEIVVATRREKERSARYKALLDFTHEGVIFLEDKQKIAYVNSAAEDLLKKNEQQLVGRKITELIKPEDAQVMSCVGRTPVLGKLFKHENESIIANIVPIYVGNQNTGTIITFFEASRLQSVEYDLRRKLASKGVRARFTLNDIIGKSRPLMLAKQKAEIFADNNSTVVITGESGVGKELFAQSIHNLSSRRNKSFVPLNCSALPKELIESELFGYEEGAFTGAKKGGKEGLFELAHGGTVFLDEIGTMPLELQSKMLRVLQEKEVTRLGGTKLIPVDVRIIVATNSNLNEDVREGKFREDLFYRLNVLPLHIPSLRERYEDIPLLFEYFVQMYNKKHWRSIQISSLKNKALLQDYYWPGNVRELMNFCERFVILSAQHKNVDDFLKESLEENTIKLNTKEEPVFPRDGSWKETWHGLEKTVLKQMISEQGMNKAELAKSLGISRTTLWKKLRE
jgi:transcriptional regulator with PAS, ATPase and Fis domain